MADRKACSAAAEAEAGSARGCALLSVAMAGTTLCLTGCPVRGESPPSGPEETAAESAVGRWRTEEAAAAFFLASAATASAAPAAALRTTSSAPPAAARGCWALTAATAAPAPAAEAREEDEEEEEPEVA